MGWLVEPDGLYDLLRDARRRRRAGLPALRHRERLRGGGLRRPRGRASNDFERVDYLRGHLDAAWRAIQDGVNLAGYFDWSLLDNFEWAWGYQKRFGLVFVEFSTQRRIPKRSAGFYGEIARTNALGSEEET